VHLRGRTVLLQALAIIAAAVLAAVVSNALAGPERRLEWLRSDVGAATISRAPVATSGASSAASSSRSGAPAPSGASNASSASASGSGAAPEHPWTEISTEEAERLFRAGVLFVDARRSSEYRLGHVRGAWSMPVWEAGLDDKVKALFAERSADQSAPIVVYCNGGECEDSHELGQKLYLSGFDAVRVYRDGFPDWSRKKLPVGTGDRP
jgi:rhodanese-related sulfurtransferase